MKPELTVTLVVEGPEDKGPPIELRWRKALKLLLRQCGLRCRDMRIVTPVEPAKKGTKMPEFRGLQGVKGALPATHVRSVAKMISTLKRRRAVSAAGHNGSLMLWRDDKKNVHVSLQRYQQELAHEICPSLTKAAAWLRKRWIEIGDQDRLATRF